MSDRERIADRLAAVLEAGLRPVKFSEADPTVVILRQCDTYEWRERARALLAEPSASAQPEPLDVERLAEAIRRTTTFRFANDETSNRAAVVIAASYAALAEPDR